MRFNSPRVLLEPRHYVELLRTLLSFNSPRVLLELEVSFDLRLHCCRFNSPRVLLEHGFSMCSITLILSLSFNSPRVLLEQADSLYPKMEANGVSILLESYWNALDNNEFKMNFMVSILLESYWNRAVISSFCPIRE